MNVSWVYENMSTNLQSFDVIKYIDKYMRLNLPSMLRHWKKLGVTPNRQIVPVRNDQTKWMLFRMDFMDFTTHQAR